ncbi:MAG: ATP-dependent helicase, partial [candidate division KSB1 bacterium]
HPPQGGNSISREDDVDNSPLEGGLRGVSSASTKPAKAPSKKKVSAENEAEAASFDLNFNNGAAPPSPAEEEAASSLIKPSKLALLNPSQQRAVQHRGTHLLIVAGPGTGKTHTLVHRILHVVEQGVSPEAVLAITFTNKAAEEMQRRLREHLGEAAQRLTTGTFHAFCLNLLRERGFGFEIVDEERQKEIAKALWPEASAAERQAWLEEISLQKAKRNCSPGPLWADDDVHDAAPHKAMLNCSPGPLWADDNVHDAAPHKGMLNCSPGPLWADDNVHDAAPHKGAGLRAMPYQTALRRERLWDFDDILLEAIALIENDQAVREQLHARYRWLFVDEYQDLNPAQHRLLKLLVHANALVTAIGDPNQAIYGFRGSEVSYFTNFAKDFPGAVEMRLEENYRSGANILSASGQVIERGEETFALPLSAALLTEGRLTIYAAPTDKAEAEYVVHEIEKMVGGTSMFSQDTRRVEREEEGSRSFGDFAILYRLNALRGPLEEALERSGMPYQISGDAPLVQRAGVLPLLALIRHAAGLSFQTKHVVELIAILTPGFGEVSAHKMIEALPQFELEKMARFAEAENLGAKVKSALLITQQSFLLYKKTAQEHGLAQALESFYQTPGLKTFLQEHKTLHENWMRVARLARRRESVRAFCDALALESASDHFEARAEKIALMTLHASKGLEFPVVFIVGCEEHLAPMQLETLAGDPAEERRLFYVGMTRAKEQLYLLRAMKRRLFGKVCEHAPSRFLSDIEEQLKAYEHWQAKPQKQVEKVMDNQLDLF